MKLVILAGGFGTRISEESHLKPKPMIEIGGRPILWHIMKIYNHYGIKDFIICLGYKGQIIKEYFYNYFLHANDITIDISNNTFEFHNKKTESWKITLIDTGLKTMTGGRLKRVKNFIGNNTFCFTYGDGLCDVNINNLINFHQKYNLEATLTAVRPPGRYGNLNIDQENIINTFVEKPIEGSGWINGGYFVLEPSVIDLIENDDTSWEKDTLEILVKKSKLGAFKHYGFWHPMDTMNDKNKLQKLWDQGKAEWKSW